MKVVYLERVAGVCKSILSNARVHHRELNIFRTLNVLYILYHGELFRDDSGLSTSISASLVQIP